MTIPELQPEEIVGMKELMKDMSDGQKQQFVLLYSGKRKKPQDILLLACLGFLGASGIHRFVIGQVGMGLLYFFTAGLCLIGTIIDLINHKQLATEYNLKQMYEAGTMARSM